MTDMEMREAIAETCGWKWNGPPEKRLHHLAYWTPPGETGRLKDVFGEQLPNYTRDLNAMHQVEDWLLTHTDLSGDYCTNLQGLLDCNCTWELVHATARQRAEAFLRTMGKWQQKPPATQPGIRT